VAAGVGAALFAIVTALPLGVPIPASGEADVAAATVALAKAKPLWAKGRLWLVGGVAVIDWAC
jgi:hypothetical protein